MNDDWRTDAQGNLIVNPLATMHTLIVGQAALAVKLGYFVEGDPSGARPSAAVQLVMTPEQAIEVAQVLNEAARHILQQQTTGMLS